MPILDWLNKRQALQAAAAVPYHLLDIEAVHGEPAPVVGVRDDPQGRARLFQIDCRVRMPDDSVPCIRTVWELRKGAACPRLVTAYPAA